MAGKDTSLKGVNPEVFENDFGETPGENFDLTEEDFAGFARTKTPPEQIVVSTDRANYKAYLKKHGIKL